MPLNFKFPNGYDVVVYKKQDILDCIDENIIDKEIALHIVEQCEIDAANYIREGRWTGIPFIGNLRIPKSRLMLHSKEQQEMIKEARNTFDTNRYVLFRKQLGKENMRHIQQERLYRYITSIGVNQDKKLYRKLCKEKGEHYARIWFYANMNIVAVDNEYINIYDNEEQ